MHGGKHSLERTHRAIRGSEGVRLADAGHMNYLEQTTAFLKEVSRFLAQ
jgi:pimeloyl-ACP methyl ester carboxylesterase